MSGPGTTGAAAAQVFAALCLALGAWQLLLSLANDLWLRHTRRIEPLSSGPSISVLVPARNEAGRIERCVESLLAQDYADYEVIVYDDDSTDGTGEILDRLARRSGGRPGPETAAIGQPPAAEAAQISPGRPRLRVIHGRKLETGWYGKPQALQALSEAAVGDYLLFTDADSVHKPGSLGRAMALARRYGAGLVSGYVGHEVRGFGPAQVVPAIYLLTMLAQPLFLIHRTRCPAISHAIGQYMFFEARAYRRLGGYAAVRRQASEDVRIARLAKRSGAKLLFADLGSAATCSMYEDYRSAVDGISKNVYDYLGKRTSLLVLATIAVSLFAFLPLLAAIWLPPGFEGARDLCRLYLLLCLATWTLVTQERRLPWYVPLISPLVLAGALSAAWRAYRLFGDGKAVLWKGRMVK